MTGFFFTISASFCIAFGAYLISNVFLEATLDQLGKSLFGLNGVRLFLGIGLNAAGSIFWILGRKGIPSYLFAWSLYLAMLVVFGTLIASIAEKSVPNNLQFLGLAMMIASIVLLKK